jgi:lipopolysaccharide transport system permease protein
VVDAASGGVAASVADVWRFRELLYVLAARDVQVRYKQTLIGVGWAVAQPLITMVVFTVVFSRFAHISSGDVPYPVLVFAGLLPWMLFSVALTRSTTSLVSNSVLVNKIYMPRLIIPLAALGAPMFDFLISLAILAALMGVYAIAPDPAALLLPAFTALALLTAVGGGLWLGYITPFLLQIVLYLSPIGYPISAVPERWQAIYSLNPLVGVIQGFRWGLLGEPAPMLGPLLGSIVLVVLMVTSGLVHFERAERTFADVI